MRVAALAAFVVLGCSAPGAARVVEDASEPYVPLVETGVVDASADTSVEDARPPRTGRRVIMQAFYWDYPRATATSGLWRTLRDRAAELSAAGVGAVWIPPPYKGAFGSGDVGYGVFDRYDLGEFDQRGTVATRYGTRAELEEAIGALHANDVHVYADVVMNHMMGGAEEKFSQGGRDFTAYTRFDFSARGGNYDAFTFDHRRFNGCDHKGWRQWSPWDFPPRTDAWDNLLGCELRLRDPELADHLVRWGRWLTTTLSLDGYRIDAVKHMHTPFVRRWLDEVPAGRFTVSEAWFGDRNLLVQYAGEVGDKTRLFDVPLHYTFSDMSNGGFDMRRLRGAGLLAVRPASAVSFVDNHDTTTSGALFSPVTNLKLHAYAYILLREHGVPCVFWKDWFEGGYGPRIAQLIAIAEQHGRGEGREHDESDEDVYIYERAGGLLLLLNDGASVSKRVRTSFSNTTLIDATGRDKTEVRTDGEGYGAFAVPARDYAIWVPR